MSWQPLRSWLPLVPAKSRENETSQKCIMFVADRVTWLVFFKSYHKSQHNKSTCNNGVCAIHLFIIVCLGEKKRVTSVINLYPKWCDPPVKVYDSIVDLFLLCLRVLFPTCGYLYSKHSIFCKLYPHLAHVGNHGQCWNGGWIDEKNADGSRQFVTPSFTGSLSSRNFPSIFLANN